MDIAEACRTVNHWQEVFAPGSTANTVPKSLSEAVTVLRHHLENARCDGKPIDELAISEHLLMTREGVRWVMPFVLSAESMEASKHRSVERRLAKVVFAFLTVDIRLLMWLVDATRVVLVIFPSIRTRRRQVRHHRS